MITEQTFTEVRVSEVLGAKCNTAGKGLMDVVGQGGRGRMGPIQVEL